MIVANPVFPELSKFQKWLRKICGAQDIVACVFVDTFGIARTVWFTGVDIRNPVELMGHVENEKP